jgi:hypothetical protein
MGNPKKSRKIQMKNKNYYFQQIPGKPNKESAKSKQKVGEKQTKKKQLISEI